MVKKQKIKTKNKISKNTVIGIGIVVVIAAIGGYFWINSLIPVNGTAPLFTPPTNTFIVAKHSPQDGYVYVSKATTSGKKSVSGGSINPTIYLTKGSAESIHFINEDNFAHSKHNINIDEFNVHSRDLGYFQTEAITFIADKEGSFHYYCSIHPEMKGMVIVE
ncbi:MAG TPA: cupredoxin domain-containing protein [Nitrosopumilaceae archaeon]|nr:cupredoxin domain-containing protein [Nitrosopumilaceae archaeon]